MKSFQHRATVAALAIVLVGSITELGSAQRRGFFGGAARVQLATLEQVQSELNLTDEQKALVKQVNDDYVAQRSELFQSGRGGDRQALLEKTANLSSVASAKLTEKLNDAQQKRLTELYVQVNGANALVDPEVGKTLNLTDEQNEALRAARDENRQAGFQAFQGFRDMSEEERREAFAKLRKEGEERLFAVLNDEQRARFDQLQGEKLDVDLSPLRRGGRGRNNVRSDRPARPE